MLPWTYELPKNNNSFCQYPKVTKIMGFTSERTLVYTIEAFKDDLGKAGLKNEKSSSAGGIRSVCSSGGRFSNDKWQGEEDICLRYRCQ
jgi:hypothetical protein